jgi:two-component system repressor protein LuxO
MKSYTEPTVLLVEQSRTFATTVESLLEKETIKLIYAETATAALEYLDKSVPDVILLDLEIPDLDGMTILNQLRQLDCNVVVIVGSNSADLVVKAMHRGAVDLIEKPLDKTQFLKTLHNVLSGQKYSHFNEIYKDPCKLEHETKQFHSFVGNSEPMQVVYNRIKQVANSKASVFITGETGTGKELCAEAIHKESQRQNKPFFPINCAALPPNLIESELFGHVKGAFSGAYQNRKGAAEAADGGTLFLDEIGEMDLDLQAKLLRFVQTGTFQKVGSHQLQKVDVRFVCATNRNVRDEIKAGRFREDLYYRLKVISIRMPPLRERGEDVLQLAHFFLRKYARIEDKFCNGFTSEAEKIVLNGEWQGNIRQLQHVIHNVVLLNEGEKISTSVLCAALDEEVEPPPTIETPLAKIRPLWEIEKQAILEVLEICKGDVIEAARRLEVGQATIYKKLKKWNVDIKKYRYQS